VIVDSSALLAVILGEDDGDRFAEAMIDAPSVRMSVANWLETAIVVDGRKSPAATVRFEDLTVELRIEIVPVTVDLGYRARRGCQEFGRGKHPARLNFGDCFAYALAKLSGEPLLFKGGDFAQTDIEPALKG
jgi:ribonuclease VapC